MDKEERMFIENLLGRVSYLEIKPISLRDFTAQPNYFLLITKTVLFSVLGIDLDVFPTPINVNKHSVLVEVRRFLVITAPAIISYFP